MDIFEKYDELDIEKVKRIVEDRIEENGIGNICLEISDVINVSYAKKMNEMYPDEEDIDSEEDINNEEDMDLVARLENEGIELDSAIDIIINSPQIIENIANGIDESINYTDDYNEIRMHNFLVINGVISLMFFVDEQTEINTENNQLQPLKEVIKNKIEQMDYLDFMLMIKDNLGSNVVMDDEYFSEVVIDKIENMNKEEFAYYISKISLGFQNTPQILEAEKRKMAEFDSNFITYLFNRSRKIISKDLILKDNYKEFTLDTLEYLKYNAINKSIKERKEVQEKENNENAEYNVDFNDITSEEIMQWPEYIKYCEVLESLNNKEFVCYMLRNGNDFLYEKEEEIISKKLCEISREDLIMLTNRLCFLEIGMQEIENKDSESLLLKIAKQNGIVDENNNLNCTEKELEEANSKYMIYSDFTKGIILPTRYVSNEEDEDLDIEYMTEDDISLYKFCLKEQEIQGLVSMFKEMEDISKQNDIDFVKMANETNMLIQTDEKKDLEYYIKHEESVKFYSEEEVEEQLKEEEQEEEVEELPSLFGDEDERKLSIECFTTLMEHKILNLPTKYAHNLRLNENGCLENAMKIKVEEAQESFEKFMKKMSGSNSGEGKINLTNFTTLNTIGKAVEEHKKKQNTDDIKHQNNHSNQDK